MKILVTGASGFAGGHLAGDLADAGHEVAAICHAHPLDSDVARRVALSLCVDLTSREAVRQMFDRFRPDVTIHAAAVAQQRVCEAFPERARDVNTEAVRVMLESAPAQSRFILLSTDLVFEGAVAPGGGFSESDVPQPRTVYARTKHEAEVVALAAAHEAAVLRVSLLFGPAVGRAHSFLGWILDGLRSERGVTLFTDEWRTPLAIADLSRVLKALLSQGWSQREVFHAAGPERLSRYEMGRIICAAVGADPQLITPALRQTSTEFRAKDVSLNSGRIRERYVLSLSPFRAALSEFISAEWQQTLHSAEV